MSKFRKKPVVIEAILWTGQNTETMRRFITTNAKIDESYAKIFIYTLEGTMTADQGDWIIQGVNGEFYPCKPDIFEKTYELVD